nr:hypothetical protein [uncultured archaeon]
MINIENIMTNIYILGGVVLIIIVLVVILAKKDN